MLGLLGGTVKQSQGQSTIRSEYITNTTLDAVICLHSCSQKSVPSTSPDDITHIVKESELLLVREQGVVRHDSSKSWLEFLTLFA